MRSRLVLPIVLTIALIPTAAFAQDAPAGLPPVNLAIAVTTAVSILLGLANLVAQGSILNLVKTAPSWATPATVVGSFLTGVLSFLKTAPQPFTGSTAFYAIFVYGLGGLGISALPAFLVHGHSTLPKMLRAARKVGPVLVMLALPAGVAAIVGQSACTPAQQAAWSKVDTIVLTDIEAGKTRAQIIADVTADLGIGSPLADTILLDSLNFLIDVGAIVLHLPEATALRNELAAEKAARDGATPPAVHLLRAAPASPSP